MNWEKPGADSMTGRLTSIHDLSFFGLDLVNLAADPHDLYLDQLLASDVDFFLLAWD